MREIQLMEPHEAEPKDDGKIARLTKATAEQIAAYKGAGIPTGQVRSDGRLLVRAPKRKIEVTEMGGVESR